MLVAESSTPHNDPTTLRAPAKRNAGTSPAIPSSPSSLPVPRIAGRKRHEVRIKRQPRDVPDLQQSVLVRMRGAAQHQRRPLREIRPRQAVYRKVNDLVTRRRRRLKPGLRSVGPGQQKRLPRVAQRLVCVNQFLAARWQIVEMLTGKVVYSACQEMHQPSIRSGGLRLVVIWDIPNAQEGQLRLMHWFPAPQIAEHGHRRRVADDVGLEQIMA